MRSTPNNYSNFHGLMNVAYFFALFALYFLTPFIERYFSRFSTSSRLYIREPCSFLDGISSPLFSYFSNLLLPIPSSFDSAAVPTPLFENNLVAQFSHKPVLPMSSFGFTHLLQVNLFFSINSTAFFS